MPNSDRFWDKIRGHIEKGTFGGGYTGSVVLHCKDGIVNRIEYSTQIRSSDLEKVDLNQGMRIIQE